MSTDKLTSIFVEEQFPFFTRDDKNQVLVLVQKYYESQELANNYIEVVRNLLNYQDLDNTYEKYFDFIVREILPNIPERVIVNRTLLAKHVKICILLAVVNKHIEFFLECCSMKK